MTDLLSPPYHRRISDTYYTPTLPPGYASTMPFGYAPPSQPPSCCTPHTTSTTTTTSSGDTEALAFKYNTGAVSLMYGHCDHDSIIHTSTSPNASCLPNSSSNNAKLINNTAVSSHTKNNTNSVTFHETNISDNTIEMDDRSSLPGSPEGSESGGSHSQTEVVSIIVLLIL